MTAGDEKAEILRFYNEGAEKNRLNRGIGQIEWERTKELIQRYLPSEKQVVYDVGGGIGTYSRWLAELGHEVHMFELAPKAVEYAKELQETNGHPIIHAIEVADCRTLDRPDESADIVLLMGPLYHLAKNTERLQALREAARVLKKDGIVIISAISRFGSLLWGLSVFGDKNNLLDEDEFVQMTEREIMDGQHIRPDKYPYLLARAYFHLPAELQQEIEAAGLIHLKTVSVEGPIWIVPAFEEKWANSDSQARLLAICKQLEEEPSLMGMSPHLLAIAKKPAQS